MTLGSQTVTFVTFTESGAADELGVKPDTAAETPVPGCLFRTLNISETPEFLTDVATEIWECTAPATTVTSNADPRGYLKFGDDVYQILAGAQKEYDFSGRLHHVIVWAQKQTG